VSIGTALAEARSSAGLTVGQVSEKTRIRETIIKGIERDDYAACGGDFYARGHIRAIARAVGTDPVPLIEEYDETLRAPEEITAAEAFRPAMPLWKREQESDPEPGSQQPEPATDRGPSRKRRPSGEPREPLWKRGLGAEPREPQEKPGPGEPREPQGERGTGAEPTDPLSKRGPAGEREPGWRRGPLWRRGADREQGTGQEPGPGSGASLITETVRSGDPHEPDTEPQPVITVPIAGTASLLEPEPSFEGAEPALTQREPAPTEVPALAEPEASPIAARPVGDLMPADRIPLFRAAREKPLTAGRPRLNWTYVLALALLAAVAVLGYLLVGGTGHGTNGAPAAASGSRRASGHTRPRPAPTAAPTPTSTPAASPVQSLSPVSATAFGPGGSQGDDPQTAQLAITGGAWHTDWYASANFGNLKSGTGLLLDMGRPVTITGAQMTLGNSGADLQLRAGNSPTMAGLSPVAGANNAGGLVQLNLSSPVMSQYVLIWFTKLPPDSSGTFQVSVSNVKLRVVS
jgi:transcriptional regulator with XRE-family HTH domain